MGQGPRLNHPKVTFIAGEQSWNAEPFSGGRDGCVCESQRQIAVLRNQFATANQIVRRGVNHDMGIIRQHAQEIQFRMCSQTCRQQIVEFRRRIAGRYSGPTLASTAARTAA